MTKIFNRRIALFILILFVLPFILTAKEKVLKNKYGTYTLDKEKGVFQSKTGNFTIVIEYNKKSDLYIVEMKGKTTGYIALGFGRSKEMKDSEIILGYVKNGETFLLHEYGTGLYRHEPIQEKEKYIKLLNSEEKDGWTFIKFSRPARIKGEKYKILQSGQTIEILYSLGAADAFKKHMERGYIPIILP
ncbi:MAG: hypothetical protein JW827_03200 [Spirochaetes bacterium]|nr:hypothetical protein [Spirochaetota bacterium]